MITSKITQNFDFNKLRNKIDEILDEVVDSVGDVVSKAMISRIEGGLRPKLRESTFRLQKEAGITRISDKPLMRTGELLKSLEYIKSQNAINMRAYGKLQNDGFDNPNEGWAAIPPRKFMDFGIKDATKETKSNLYKRIRKALRK